MFVVVLLRLEAVGKKNIHPFLSRDNNRNRQCRLNCQLPGGPLTFKALVPFFGTSDSEVASESQRRRSVDHPKIALRTGGGLRMKEEVSLMSRWIGDPCQAVPRDGGKPLNERSEASVVGLSCLYVVSSPPNLCVYAIPQVN